MTVVHALALTNVGIKAGDRLLAEGVDLTIDAGEVHAIMGPSGGGKSTLLWTVLGLLPSAAGEILVEGEPISARRPARAAAIRRDHTGVVYQQPGLVHELTVVENVAAPLMLTRRLSRAAAEQVARDLLGELGIDPSASTRQLSGGEQQRVAVARATAGSPALIVADEPTAALDEASADVVMDALVGRVRERDGALLMVTHDSRVAARADVVWELRDGRLRNAAAVRGR